MSKTNKLLLVSFLEVNVIFSWHVLGKVQKYEHIACKTLAWIPLDTYLTIFFNDSIKIDLS